MQRPEDFGLAYVFRSAFVERVRQAGERYFREGRVRIVARDAELVRAEVQGSDAYEVQIRFDHGGGGVGVVCSCPVFGRWGPCKHVWAAVLEADRQGASGFQPPQADWRERLEFLRDATADPAERPWRAVAAAHASRVAYRLEVTDSDESDELVLRSFYQRRLKSGGWGRRRPFAPDLSTASVHLEPLDERFFRLAPPPPEVARGWGGYFRPRFEFRLEDELCRELLPPLARSGRLFLDDEEDEPLAWDPGEPWRLRLALVPVPAASDGAPAEPQLELEAKLVRGDEELDAHLPLVLLECGFLVTGTSVACFDPSGGLALVRELRQGGSLRIPERDRDSAVSLLLSVAGSALAEAPELVIERGVAPQPHLFVASRGRKAALGCTLTFHYGEATVGGAEPGELARAEDGTLVARDHDAEAHAFRRFLEAGGHRGPGDEGEDHDATIAVRKLPALARILLAEDWIIEADGRVWRRASALNLSVSSGIDWFDLEGGLRFGEGDDQVATLPAILAAVRRGEGTVRLGDGSFGVLPERWLAGQGLLEVASAEGDALRFQGHQAFLLDALLAQQEGEVAWDAGFAAHRERIATFDGIRPRDEPAGFRGELRAYQKDGLGWFDFLDDLGLGGCLADDMGLGKTVQVLALLQGLRASRGDGEHPPSLVVAPRSLIFNWIEEAERFTPELRVLSYTGPDRRGLADGFDAVDLVVTTYGTLRRDVLQLKEREFDYVVLDESQAIKNAQSQVAKAARLLRARRRLALSGTPIENHLGELWSLFEFLNPGMLGASRTFQRLIGNRRSTDGEDLELLRVALRPFLLRRRKEDVLDDLPEKGEQTIHCELGDRQREAYDELRDHYRGVLLNRLSPDDDSWKFQVLEALLRLRQVACHPGLVDKARTDEESAKLDTLVSMLEELVDAGHKALVFSQFTSFLALVRERLDGAGLRYAYLDGQTRDRRAPVEAFQTEDDCPLFLISLKAGGHGLNLTAADYVFLLDPWWNPAVEAQAIDRAHRIGQTRPVLAYRLIARDTVEDRVLELQESKRELAQAILGEGEGVLRNLTREDLARIFA